MNRKLYTNWVLAAGIAAVIILAYVTLMQAIPDEMHIVAGEEESFDFQVPVTSELTEEDQEVFGSLSESADSNNLHLSASVTDSLLEESDTSFHITCKLFGLIPVKEVSVEVVDAQSLIPGGIPIGIYVKTQGVMVIGTGSVTGLDGVSYEPAENILKSGDYILSVNGTDIQDKEQLIENISAQGAEAVTLGIVRNDEQMEVKVTPVQVSSDTYKLGVWVRDDLAGIGTLTYVAEDGSYGALGHSISDTDTGLQVDIGSGFLYQTSITSIIKGEDGTPGELSGVIDFQSEFCLGTITENTNHGIFGTLYDVASLLDSTEALPVAMKQQVHTGEAYLVCCLDGETTYYTVNIEELNLSESAGNKAILFEVTDEELINLTGGIVQGMSGSCLVQDGQIIGAVTHVFVNNPQKGYGIFIEDMLVE